MRAVSVTICKSPGLVHRNFATENVLLLVKQRRQKVLATGNKKYRNHV